MIAFQRASSFDAIQPLREAYLDGLPEPQELFLEMRVQAAQPVVILVGGKTAGYLVHDRMGTLVEYFVLPHVVTRSGEVFDALQERFEIQHALCKSFDYDLLTCCLDRGASVEVLGLHFRTFHAAGGRLDTLWTEARLARTDEASRIKSIRHGLFDSDEEVDDCLARGVVQLFLAGKALMGCGLLQTVIPGRPEVDIGMLVHPAHRGKGVGTAILRYLVDQVLAQGGRPIAGCAVDNLASRRTLERAGFVSRHRLLAFHF